MPAPIDLLGDEAPRDLAGVREVVHRARHGGVAYRPSPLDWRDEVLYFLLPDRFSDEDPARGVLRRDEIAALRRAAGRPGWSWADWARSGTRWQGGTLRGLRSRLGYLQDLGVSAIWVGPVYKHRARLDTYHGYGIQDFCDVDPRFGSRRDLVELVADAHGRGLRIILDVILNHTGDNWAYVPPGADLADERRKPPYRPWPDHYGNPHGEQTRGWRLAWRGEDERPTTVEAAALAPPHAGVWPRDLQDVSRYTRAGVGSFGHRSDLGDLDDPHAEHKRIDFDVLKDIALDVGANLSLVADLYKYWIAVTDCDGFRIDTVKHMALEETRDFCGAIREFADSVGKANFLLVGEIAGGDGAQDFVLDFLALSQRNMSAALDIGSAREQLAAAAKGLAPGGAYLGAFDGSGQGFESHRARGSRHVSILDDHDHVFGPKVRFSADIPDDSPVKDHQVVAATAFQLFTLGIPCIYYGSEQAFAGPAIAERPYLAAEGWDDGANSGDRYLREAMFGPSHPRAAHDEGLDVQLGDRDESLPGFGPFGTAGKHVFDQASPSYLRARHLCRTRRDHQVLRAGRQYPRQVRLPHTWFEMPAAGELVAWSRLLDDTEALVVVNPNGEAVRGGDVVVSSELSPPGTVFTVVANTAEAVAGGQYVGTHPVGSTVTVTGLRFPGEPSFVPLRGVGPAEVIVLVA